jgi:hypothetical protein
VPGFVGGNALMRPSSRSPRAHGLCEVTVLVPEGCAEDIRHFAQELRVRHRAEPAQAPQEWRALSPSAELLVDPDRRARCSVRDTLAPGAHRFLWSVTLSGSLLPIAKGRAGERAEARQLAEAALSAYAADWSELSGGRSGDG